MLRWLAGIALLLAPDSTNAEGERSTQYEPQVFEGMPCRVMKPLEFDAG